MIIAKAAKNEEFNGAAQRPEKKFGRWRNLRKKITFFKCEVGGSVVEYALLLGFSIFIFLVIVGIILSIVGWVDLELQNFFNQL